jgi:hypothetical protein
MTLAQILVLAAIAIVVLKFIVSLFGKEENFILNGLVTVILALFVAFEVINLGQILWQKFL